MKVVESVQIVCKLQVSLVHPAFDNLCCLLLHGGGGLGGGGWCARTGHPYRGKRSILDPDLLTCIGTEFSFSLMNPSALRIIAI